jgi:hypothetical protein
MGALGFMVWPEGEPRKRPTRYQMKTILADPALRRELMIMTGIALQAREGIDTTYEQMAAAYDKVQREAR